jgi:hypothetical protein
MGARAFNAARGLNTMAGFSPKPEGQTNLTLK